jgi:hypothetical protein
MDETKFTAIEQPIIDIAKPNSNFLLLLANGNMISNSGILNTNITTNRKMVRMVKFGTEIIGLDKKGKLYSQNKSASTNTTWVWEHLTNYPRNVVFINSTNSGSNLEVITCEHRAYLYNFSSNWKDGNFVNQRKTKDLRFYGKDTSRYIDINEETNIGFTNDGVKYKHVKGAGFYSTGANGGDIITLLEKDCFTHVRVLSDNRAYFLFEQ